MLTKDFDYDLPWDRIAQTPIVPRDHSQLMVVDRKKKTIVHRHFYDIGEYLQPGDVIVWNNSRVFKARLFGKLLSHKGEGLWEHQRDVELFLVRPTENTGVWRALAKPGKHVRHGMRVAVAADLSCEVMVKEPEGTLLVQFPFDEKTVREKANHYGHIPVPPYVKDEAHELESYQTVYAKAEGSVAAPTAGFHFTPGLIQKLKEKGVEFAEVTLHVGLGTFLPVKTERVDDHTMHSEWVELTEENAEKINRAKKEERRVIAVGTTTVRTLEGIAILTADSPASPAETSPRGGRRLKAFTGDINLFIKPGFEFTIIDALITNFHLPKSTLLMLVAAFANDQAFMLDCYKEAIARGYRFYSFGDAMFLR